MSSRRVLVSESVVGIAYDDRAPSEQCERLELALRRLFPLATPLTVAVSVTWSRGCGAWRLVSAVATLMDGTRVGLTDSLVAALRGAGLPFTDAEPTDRGRVQAGAPTCEG